MALSEVVLPPESLVPSSHEALVTPDSAPARTLNTFTAAETPYSPERVALQPVLVRGSLLGSSQDTVHARGADNRRLEFGDTADLLPPAATWAMQGRGLLGHPGFEWNGGTRGNKNGEPLAPGDVVIAYYQHPDTGQELTIAQIVLPDTLGESRPGERHLTVAVPGRAGSVSEMLETADAVFPEIRELFGRQRLQLRVVGGFTGLSEARSDGTPTGEESAYVPRKSYDEWAGEHRFHRQALEVTKVMRALAGSYQRAREQDPGITSFDQFREGNPAVGSLLYQLPAEIADNVVRAMPDYIAYRTERWEKAVQAGTVDTYLTDLAAYEAELGLSPRRDIQSVAYQAERRKARRDPVFGPNCPEPVLDPEPGLDLLNPQRSEQAGTDGEVRLRRERSRKFAAWCGATFARVVHTPERQTNVERRIIALGATAVLAAGTIYLMRNGMHIHGHEAMYGTSGGSRIPRTGSPPTLPGRPPSLHGQVAANQAATPDSGYTTTDLGTWTPGSDKGTLIGDAAAALKQQGVADPTAQQSIDAAHQIARANNLPWDQGVLGKLRPNFQLKIPNALRKLIGAS